MTQTEITRRDVPQGRRDDLDWLRILAFAVLILYHVGMYYVADWDWHIKSNITSVALQDWMILTNPWRMSLLFLLSAMALSLAQQKTTATATTLLLRRSSRLLIPLLFGMFVIVTPQVYYEALSQNLIEPGYLAFWWQYVDPATDLLVEHHSPIGLLTWNHLWFLPYLWCYTVLVLWLRSPLNTFAKLLQPVRGRYALLALVLIFVPLVFFLRPLFETTHALLDDWYNHARYFGVFVAGYLLAQHKAWWQAVIDHRRWFLVMALCCYSFAIAERHELFPVLSAQFEHSIAVQLGYRLNSVLNHWGWLLAVLGYAGFWLHRPTSNADSAAGTASETTGVDRFSTLRRYCNQAILPWYMLHQTLIIIFASWLKPLAIPVALEAILLIGLTCAGCYLGFELIRRLAILRWLFGVSTAKRSTFPPQKGIVYT